MGTLRAALQQRGTKSAKSAKRHLKQLSGPEARLRRDANHRVSTHIGAKAKRTHNAPTRHSRWRT